jgi:hypothetical protein
MSFVNTLKIYNFAGYCSSHNTILKIKDYNYLTVFERGTGMTKQKMSNFVHLILVKTPLLSTILWQHTSISSQTYHCKCLRSLKTAVSICTTFNVTKIIWHCLRTRFHLTIVSIWHFLFCHSGSSLLGLFNRASLTACLTQRRKIGWCEW